MLTGPKRNRSFGFACPYVYSLSRFIPDFVPYTLNWVSGVSLPNMFLLFTVLIVIFSCLANQTSLIITRKPTLL